MSSIKARVGGSSKPVDGLAEEFEALLQGTDDFRDRGLARNDDLDEFSSSGGLLWCILSFFGRPDLVDEVFKDLVDPFLVEATDCGEVVDI